MNVKNVLIISDDNKERLSELSFVAHKFCSNIDAVIFTSKDEIKSDFRKVYGISNLPENSINMLHSVSKNYELILINGIVGASVGAILAYKLKACCISGVSSIRYDDLIFLHSAYGDKAIIEYKPLCLPLVVILKEKYFEQASFENESNVEWLSVENKVEVLKEEMIEKEVDLDKAKIVIGGGRGVGSKDGFEILDQLAGKLGGVIGASRSAVDNGWISHQYQIGQSGTMLSANLYLAFGISGATQHLSGIKNVKCVVAINTDEEAPIFKRARYNIVANWKDFIVALMKQLEGKNG